MKAINYIKRYNKKYIGNIDNDYIDNEGKNYNYYEILNRRLNRFINNFNPNIEELKIHNIMYNYTKKYNIKDCDYIDVIENEGYDIIISNKFNNLKIIYNDSYCESEINYTIEYNKDLDLIKLYNIYINNNIHIKNIICNSINIHNCIIDNLQVNKDKFDYCFEIYDNDPINIYDCKINKLNIYCSNIKNEYDYDYWRYEYYGYYNILIQNSTIEELNIENYLISKLDNNNIIINNSTIKKLTINNCKIIIDNQYIRIKQNNKYLINVKNSTIDTFNIIDFIDELNNKDYNKSFNIKKCNINKLILNDTSLDYIKINNNKINTIIKCY